LVFTPVAEAGDELTSELHGQLAVLGDDALGGMDHLRSRIPSESLSTRQWEILVRLTRGEAVHDIANALYLSPSTVRNHLTVIYKKFGVHSQAGLLAKVLEAIS
jgi:DNA-binding NarL/FixJ family response regulator